MGPVSIRRQMFLKTDAQSAQDTSENSLVCKMDRTEAVRKGDRWEQTKKNGNDGKGSGEKKIKNGEMH